MRYAGALPVVLVVGLPGADAPIGCTTRHIPANADCTTENAASRSQGKAAQATDHRKRP